MTSSQTAPGEQPVADNVEPLEQQGRQAVRRIFTTLKIAFPAWYEKHYGNEMAEKLARRVWLVTTRDLGDEAIDRGLQRMAAECSFPPSPKDFVDLCTTGTGIPNEDEAWIEALMGEYSHEAVKHAAAATGTFDLKGSKADNASLRKRFSRNYAIVRARAVMGKPLTDDIPEGIEHEQKTPMQIQLAASHQQARDLIQAQNIPTDPHQARKLLMAKMGLQPREPKHA